jgi:hypothetical protein
MPPQLLLNDLEYISLPLFPLLAALHNDFLAAGPYLHIRPRPHKRIAPNLLATLHRLQQKSIRLIARHRKKG